MAIGQRSDARRAGRRLTQASVLEPVTETGLIAGLRQQPAEPLLSLIDLFHKDKRAEKVDLGVGVYVDESGRTPIFAAVKGAEARLLEEQETKAYVGSLGDRIFLDLVKNLLLGEELARSLGDRIVGIQATGGTGALRLGADLLKRAGAGAVLLGRPTWANHPPIFDAAGLPLKRYDYFSPATQKISFDRMLACLEGAQSGDVALLHGCCHNPSGVDLHRDQWRQIADIMARRGITPFIDIAYQGLGHGLEADAWSTRLILEQAPEAIVATSCAKNFGLYRERTGALFVLSKDAAGAGRAISNLVQIARANYSMPPDHGASVVRLVLSTKELRQSWRAELETMRTRMFTLRGVLADAARSEGVDLEALRTQAGMFSILPLSPEQVLDLRNKDAIYTPEMGRVNICGVRRENAARLAKAFAARMAE
jgi:aromatic-amino-acid transaminase